MQQTMEPKREIRSLLTRRGAIQYEASLAEKIFATKAFAESIGKYDDFEDMLARVVFTAFFGRPARAILLSDHAPHSFGFEIQYQDAQCVWRHGLNGALIYRANEQSWDLNT